MPSRAIDGFCASRLALARKRRGLTKAALAARAGVSTRSITNFENAGAAPSQTVIAALADALSFPVQFFLAGPIDSVDPECVSFRCASRMPSSRRDAAVAAATLGRELTAWIAARFDLPLPDVPDMSGQTPEDAAGELRARWGLSDRPVRSMVHLLESKGVRVYSLDLSCTDLDAFSFWHAGSPFAFLNIGKSAERGRYDAAHELGHLVLHQRLRSGSRDMCREADIFAGHFLMPGPALRACTPRFLDIGRIHDLKTTWGVSAMALVYQCHRIGLITRWSYSTLCREISAEGGRKREKHGGARETSQLLPKVLRALEQERIYRTDIAKDLCIRLEDIEALVFGLVPTRVPNNS